VAGEMVPIPSGTAAHAHENRLSAGGGDARGARAGEAGNTSDGQGCSRSLHRVQKIYILRSEISQDS
jgi:hypothetical protein